MSRRLLVVPCFEFTPAQGRIRDETSTHIVQFLVELCQGQVGFGHIQEGKPHQLMEAGFVRMSSFHSVELRQRLLLLSCHHQQRGHFDPDAGIFDSPILRSRKHLYAGLRLARVAVQRCQRGIRFRSGRIGIDGFPVEALGLVEYGNFAVNVT